MARFHNDIMCTATKFPHKKTIHFFKTHISVCIAGLYVLSSGPVRIPWFDFVFADIGDEQSLSQSLSTFSGHLKQTSVCHFYIF